MGVGFGSWWCSGGMGRGCGWVLILHGAVVMETTPVEAWRSASDGESEWIFL